MQLIHSVDNLVHGALYLCLLLGCDLLVYTLGPHIYARAAGFVAARRDRS